MSEEENKAIAHRFFEEIWNQGNFNVFDELVNCDIMIHAAGKDFNGSEKYNKFILGFRNAFPDIKFTIDEQIALGDKVVERWTAQGTHQGQLQNIPPTGKQMKITGIEITRIVDGKIVERWGSPDFLTMMQQIGIIPKLGLTEP